MLVTFNSRAGEITMFGDVAERFLNIIGKNLGRQGVISVEQIPEAITRLKQAIDIDKAQQSKESEVNERQQDDKISVDEEEPVTMAARVFPLIQLLERSQEEESPVTWGS